MAPVKGLVSVALCTCDGERFLDEQLASVLAQQDVNLEVVVCDDASNDRTWTLVLGWAERDARIRPYRHEVRLGLSANFARAMSLCRGEFIAPCDQDDIWHPRKLSRLLETIGDQALNYCDSELVDETGATLGQRISDRVRMYRGRGLLPLCFWNSVSGHAMVFRRELLEAALPFPEQAYHDWWLACVAAGAGGVGYLPEPLVRYRQHGRSVTDVAQRRAGPRDSWALYRTRARWLRQLAELPGADQPYLRRLAELWAAREHQWFSPALCLHLARRTSELMRLNRREGFARFAFKQFLGQRWRKTA